MDIKTDNEIMIELFDRFNKSDSNEEKLTILKDIEFYVHQVIFVFYISEGFDLEKKISLINVFLSTTTVCFCSIWTDSTWSPKSSTKPRTCLLESRHLQCSVPLFKGSYIFHVVLISLLPFYLLFNQIDLSNPKAQIQAFKSQLLELILSSLSKQLQSTAELALNNHEYNSKLLFSLSTLLRNFPFAQKEFVRFGGVELLDKLVESSTSLKVKLKAVTLLNDLIQEKSDVLKSPDEQSANESKVLQYKE